MQVKVVANMAHWSHRSVAEQAWDFLELELAPDFALLQETIPISRSRDRFCVWQEIGGSRKWGSAVVSRKLPLTELPLKTNAYPGALTVAEADVPGKFNIVLDSMYGQMDEHGYSITTLHRMLSDLTHLLHGKL